MAVGIYLPLERTVAIFVDGVISWVSLHYFRKNRDSIGPDGILLAIPFAAARSTDVIAIAPENFG